MALRGRWIKNHAVEFYRLLGMSLERRSNDADGKGQDRKTLHRTSPVICTRLMGKNRKFLEEWKGTFP